MTGSSQDSAFRRTGQIQIFGVTWLTYAGYYLCRKNFGVVIPIWVAAGLYSELDLANCVFLYSLLYAVAQLAIGPLADRIGSKAIVVVGLLVVIISNLLMSVPHRPSVLLILAALNGTGQATGWSGLVRCMANWFAAEERGIVMAWWGTNYALGGFAATLFATACAANLTFWPALGWHRAFLFPSALLLVIAVLFFALVRDSPDSSDTATVHKTVQATSQASAANDSHSSVKDLLKSPVLWIISASYLLLEMTRYGFLFWLPLYLTKEFAYTSEGAGYMSSLFELVGFVGAVLAGYLSDRVFSSRRLPVGAIMLGCFGLVILGEPWLAATGYIGVAASISAMGMFCYGPDTLLCGAAAQDVGGHEHAGAASGIIDGLGHLGSIVSPYLVIYVSKYFGWSSLFFLFGTLALSAAAILCFEWNFQAPELRGETSMQGQELRTELL